jgi:hypothetical protein
VAASAVTVERNTERVGPSPPGGVRDDALRLSQAFLKLTQGATNRFLLHPIEHRRPFRWERLTGGPATDTKPHKNEKERSVW